MNRALPETRRVLVATFDREERVMAALPELRRRGYRIEDVYAPYPVHGMDRAAGLAPSRLGWVCGAAGLAAAVLMMLFQVWVSAADWPVDVGGKPMASLPAFVPVAFEAGVLAAALTTVAALFAVSRLRPGKRPGLVDPRVTDDVFAVVLDEADAAFDPDEARDLLREHGALETEERVFHQGGEVAR